MNRINTVALLAALALPCAASAGTFTGWTLNGSATLVDSDDTLQLTSADPFLAGSAWAPFQASLLQDFSVAFSFRIHDGSHADGFTFTVQNAFAAEGALGAAGGGLGYEGIDHSMAIVYDTYDNGLDTDRISGPDFADNTSVAYSGNLATPWAGASVGTEALFANGLREQTLYSWVDYSAANQQFLMYLSDTNTKPAVARENISFSNVLFSLRGPDVLLGFTAGTGSSSDFHDIQSFSYTTTPVPLPAAAWLLAPAALTLLRNRRRA